MSWKNVITEVVTQGQDVGDTRELLGYLCTGPMADLGFEMNQRHLAHSAYRFITGNPLSEWPGPQHANCERHGDVVAKMLTLTLDKLLDDSNTRQAVITFDDSFLAPCVTSLQFLIRAGQLHCVINSRSSDTLNGLPFDLMNARCLAWYLVLQIRAHYALSNSPLRYLSIGYFTHFAGSQHIYHEDMKNKFTLIPQNHLLPLVECSPKEWVEYLKTYGTFVDKRE